ncbi:MAG: DUF4846 domain-containing protein [Polyangiaceae bacterium]
MEGIGRQWIAVLCALGVAACHKPQPDPDPTPSARASAQLAPSAAPSAEAPPSSEPSPSVAPAATAEAPSAPDPKRYAWLADDTLKYPKAVTTLSQRFPPPPSYERLPVKPGSFGEWLRGLPLAAPGTPVLSYKGEELVAGDNQYLGAVVAIDVGTNDLQTSSDMVLRLNAEWKFATDQDIEYKSATGLELPFSRWLAGDRLKAAGAAVAWVRNAKAAEKSHQQLRAFMDQVYTWANSTSLISHTDSVAPEDIQPGDFLIHSKKPSHVVVLLDIARNSKGKLVALLGRSLNPAQSFHVLRLGLNESWYNIDPQSESLLTPGTVPFPWSNLRRVR